MNSSLMSMGLLVDTVQQLSLAKDLESVMRIVRTVARNITGADGASFVLRDGEFCYYADEDAISPLWKGSRFPLEICISGWSMLNKQPAVIEDIYADSRIPADAYRPTFVKSLAMVPIRKIDPIGAIGNYWATTRMPTEEEVALLQALADITAVSIENIYTRNTLEEKVVERTRELEESLERETKLGVLRTAFLSMASHEFRTPLSTIVSSTWLASQYADADQQPQREKHYTRIRSSVENLMGILDDFLSVDKLEQGKVVANKEELDLQEFVAHTVEELDGLLKLNQTIKVCHDGATQIFADKGILRNLIVNLLSNAIKYSEKDIELSAEVAANSNVIIKVRDHGIGIPKADHEKMFSKYFRASNSVGIKGTGLGLNIVKHYVDLLKGTISFESEEGIGTTFIVELPNVVSDIQPAATEQRA